MILTIRKGSNWWQIVIDDFVKGSIDETDNLEKGPIDDKMVIDEERNSNWW